MFVVYELFVVLFFIVFEHLNLKVNYLSPSVLIHREIHLIFWANLGKLKCYSGQNWVNAGSPISEFF